MKESDLSLKKSMKENDQKVKESHQKLDQGLPQNESTPKTRFLVLEFRGDETFRKLLATLEDNLPRFVNKLSRIQSTSEAYNFCAAFAK